MSSSFHGEGSFPDSTAGLRIAENEPKLLVRLVSSCARYKDC